jgi:hypothetical protein
VTVTDSEKFTVTATVSPALYDPLSVVDDTDDTVGATVSMVTLEASAALVGPVLLPDAATP